MPSNVLPLRLKQTFPPIIWIFTEGEGDGIESRLPFKIFSALREKGSFGLYRGLSVLVLGSIPKSAVRFGAFEQFKSMRVDKNGNLAPLDRLICGLGAGICEAILAVTPTETIKVKFINDQRSRNPKFRGLFHGVKSIVAEQGLKGTYQGLSATIMKQGSNQVRNNFFLLFTK